MIARRRTTSLILGVLLLLAPLAAHGQPTEEDEKEARVLYEKGVRHFHLAEYDEAIAAYKEGYRLVEAPGFLFNIALAYRMKGDCGQAVHFYESYLRLEPEAPNRKEVELRIAELQSCERERAPGHASSASRSVPNASPVTQSARPPSPKGPSWIETPRGKQALGVGLAAASGICFGTAVYFGLEARSASQELNDFFRSGGEWNAYYRGVEAKQSRSTTRAAVLSAAGGALLVGSGLAYYLGWRQERAAKGHVSVSPGTGGASVTWTLSF
ncbi:MAG: hypothetical protein HY698_16350 [Deltaproteobacteria bacterium]|nr:hypothetical protein [Deltaproteobacteria bacterium]